MLEAFAEKMGFSAACADDPERWCLEFHGPNRGLGRRGNKAIPNINLMLETAGRCMEPTISQSDCDLMYKLGWRSRKPPQAQPNQGLRALSRRLARTITGVCNCITLAVVRLRTKNMQCLKD